MSQRILVYGATGYTGRLIADEAAERGLDVVLAGRDAEGLKRVAEAHGFETRVATLDDGPRLRAALDEIGTVLHIAGPFSATSAPMVDACLELGLHYLDVTGEIEVFEAIARRDEEARGRGVTLLPGVGFDVVPTDCLAAHVAKRVEDPTALRLAIAMDTGVSRGTAKTMVEGLGDGLRIRRDGVLINRPAGSLERDFDLGAGPTRGLGMTWGDVATAFHSTGIPDIEVYFIVSGALPGMMKASRLVAPLLRRESVQRFLKRRIDALPPGPSERDRDAGRALILAEVEGPGGQFARSQLETPHPYVLTHQAAVELAAKVSRGEAPSGYQTPSSAFGADFVLGLPDVTRTDLD